jgi:hypothetical protein
VRQASSEAVVEVASHPCEEVAEGCETLLAASGNQGGKTEISPNLEATSEVTPP